VRNGVLEPLRAEIRTIRDIFSGYQDSWTVTEMERVLSAVKAFLNDVLST